MRQKKNTVVNLVLTVSAIILLLCAGCAGPAAQSRGQGDYVEIDNPAFTMSSGAPEKIWVPRSYVDNGVPRGGDLVKKGYEAAKNSLAPAPQQNVMPAQDITPGPAVAPAQAGIMEPSGKPGRLIPQFGMVVAVDKVQDKERVYFNLGREAGYFPGQILKVHRGGTVIEGLGLAPGELIATIEVIGYVGSKGGYGLVKQGGPVWKNDLVGVE